MQPNEFQPNPNSAAGDNNPSVNPENREFQAQQFANNPANFNQNASNLTESNNANGNIYSAPTINNPQTQQFPQNPAQQNHANYPQFSNNQQNQFSNQTQFNQPQFAQNPNLANSASQTPNTLSASQYLEEISAQNRPKKQSFFSSGKIFLFGGLALALVVTLIIAAIMNSARPSSAQFAIDVGTEITNLQTLIEYGKSNNVSSANSVKAMSETSLAIISRQNDLAEHFTLTEEEKNKEEASEPEFVGELDSAKSVGNLETEYLQKLKDQLNSVYIKLNELNNQVKSAEQQAAVTNTINDIKELYTRIDR